MIIVTFRDGQVIEVGDMDAHAVGNGDIPWPADILEVEMDVPDVGRCTYKPSGVWLGDNRLANGPIVYKYNSRMDRAIKRANLYHWEY